MTQNSDQHTDRSAMALPQSQSLHQEAQLRGLLEGRPLLVGNPSPAYASVLRSNLLRSDIHASPPQLLAICTTLEELATALESAGQDLLLVTTSQLRDGCCIPLLLELIARPDPPRLLVVLGVEEPPLPLVPLLQHPFVLLAWEGNVGRGVLLEALLALDQGQRFVDPDVRRLIDADLAIAGSLTTREREVLQLVAEGLTNRQIAERLIVAEVTARDHVQRILRKLAVPDRTAAAVLALRLGLVG
ncbi:MAG: response regulator transcription factor [Synechococcaceae cyanobacterium]|nr:response regulator transcription factor [Synechococcaceae cyanobacterium]